MIHQVYFAGLRKSMDSLWGSHAPWTGANTFQMLADLIKDKSEDDSFVFITTRSQEYEMVSFIKEYSLEPHLHFEMPEFITNQNHPGNGRNLKLRVFKNQLKEAA